MEDQSKILEDSVLLSNKSAVEHLRKEKYDHAMFFLNQALLTAKGMKDSSKKSNLLAMTYNNLGCYLKRINKAKQALEYFLKASDLARHHDTNIANITCSHLNISKIYSEQGDHEKALRHALKSLFLLRHNFAEKKTLVSSLIIAYQTVGIEYLHLNQNADSVECFETGLGLSVKNLGKDHEVTKAMRNSLKEASGKSQRCQSHQSKKRSHFRGRSAGISKVGSNIEIAKKTAESAIKKKPVKATTRVYEEEVHYRYNIQHIKAAAFIQGWWKEYRGRRKSKDVEAAIRIQKWWRGIRGRKLAEKLRARNKVSKRYIIRNPRVQNEIKRAFNDPKTKDTINERERRLLVGSTKLLDEIKKSDPKKKVSERKDDQSSKVPGGRYSENLEKYPVGNSYQKPELTSSSFYKDIPQKDNKKSIDKLSYDEAVEVKKEPFVQIPKKLEKNPIKSEEYVELPHLKAKAKESAQIPEGITAIQSEAKGNILPKEPVKKTERQSISQPRNSKVGQAKPAETRTIDMPSNKYDLSKEMQIIEFKNELAEIRRKKALDALKSHENALTSHKENEHVPAKTKEKKRMDVTFAPIPQGITNPPAPSNYKKKLLESRRPDITHQINSLVKIQSFIRMVPRRLFYLKLAKSAHLIQRVYKGHLVRKLFQAIRDAVIFIQYMYRKYKNKH